MRKRLLLEVRRAVLSHLKDCLHAEAISTASAIDAIRHQLPRCKLTDEELTRVVAEVAIEAGFALHFDKEEEQPD